jgi:hypothetical protein
MRAPGAALRLTDAVCWRESISEDNVAQIKQAVAVMFCLQDSVHVATCKEEYSRWSDLHEAAGSLYICLQ